MDDKAINVVLHNAFGSYSARIASGIKLMQRIAKDNCQIVLKFSKDYSEIWKKCLDATTTGIIESSAVYCEYKPSFSSSKIRFTQNSSQNYITRALTILDIKESETCAASVSMAYVDARSCDTQLSLERINIYKVHQKTLDLYRWKISLCDYTYGESEFDHRLERSPIDRSDVECVYVGNIKDMKQNFLKLIAILGENYDYKRILLKSNSATIMHLPQILSNRDMNEIDIFSCKLYEVFGTKFNNIVIYHNLWNPLDIVITENDREIYSKQETYEMISTSKFYKTIITQDISITHEGMRYVLKNDTGLEELFTPMKQFKAKSWQNAIENNSMFMVYYNSKLYYYNKNVVINYSLNSSHKFIDVWKTILPSMNQTRPCTIKLKGCDGKWVNTEIIRSEPDSEELIFNKLCSFYSNKYEKICKSCSISSVILLIYQYITENVLVNRAHEVVIHIFDSQIISANELIKLCNIVKLFLVGERHYIVEYFKKIISSDAMGTISSSSSIVNKTPQIEILNIYKQDFVESLIRDTSFINNSVDAVYLQNNLSIISTFPKLVKFAKDIKSILSRRGHLYIIFFNLDVIETNTLHICKSDNAFTIRGDDGRITELILTMFSPKIYTKRIGEQCDKNKSIIINRDVDKKELEEIYIKRAKFEDVFTIIVSRLHIICDKYAQYSIMDGKYELYVLYPKSYIQYKPLIEYFVKTNTSPYLQFAYDDVKYYCIHPKLLEVFGEYEYTVFPYKTKLLTSIISPSSGFSSIITHENENIFRSLQLCVY